MLSVWQIDILQAGKWGEVNLIARRLVKLID